MSSNFKDRIIRIEDIPSDGKRLLEQNLKPYFPLLVLLVCGIVLIILPSMRYFGIALTCILVFIIFGTSNRKLFTITDKFIVTYPYNNSQQCHIFYLDEILTWEYKTGKTTLDIIELRLSDGSTYPMETTYPNKPIGVLRSIMKEKEIKFKKKF